MATSPNFCNELVVGLTTEAVGQLISILLLLFRERQKQGGEINGSGTGVVDGVKLKSVNRISKINFSQ